MASTDYERLRAKTLETAPDRGRNLMDDAFVDGVTDGQLHPDVVSYSFADATLQYSKRIEDVMHTAAETDVQEEAAEFLGYEAREAARKAGLNTLETDTDEYETAVAEEWDTWLADSYEAFGLVDQLAGGDVYGKFSHIDGLEDADTDRFDPSDPYRNQRRVLDRLGRDDGVIMPEEAGAFYLDDIYVVDNDWILYKRGGTPLGMDEDTEQYLRDLGVGQ